MLDTETMTQYIININICLGLDCGLVKICFVQYYIQRCVEFHYPLYVREYGLKVEKGVPLTPKIFKKYPTLQKVFFCVSLSAVFSTQQGSQRDPGNLVLRGAYLDISIRDFSRHYVLSGETQRRALARYQSEDMKTIIN